MLDGHLTSRITDRRVQYDLFRGGDDDGEFFTSIMTLFDSLLIEGRRAVVHKPTVVHLKIHPGTVSCLLFLSFPRRIGGGQMCSSLSVRTSWPMDLSHITVTQGCIIPGHSLVSFAVLLSNQTPRGSFCCRANLCRQI